MESQAPKSMEVVAARRQLLRRFLDAVLCRGPRGSPTSPTTPAFESFLLSERSANSGPPPNQSDDEYLTSLQDNDSAPAKKDLSHLAETADSVATFILTTLQSLGSNLPGVGAIGVILSVKDKFKIAASNSKETDEILTYIKELCSTADFANRPKSEVLPTMELVDAKLIMDLRLASEILKKSQERNLADRTINAQARAEELKAIWHGIDLSLQKFHLRAALNVDVLLNTVLQKLDIDHGILLEVHDTQLVDHETLKAARETQLVEISVAERKRLDDTLDQLPRAKEARFDSARTEQTRMKSCSDGTREGVLQEIQEWASSEDSHREHIFWLNGLAGIGKSTIATTIARWAHDNGILGGSFFFSRDVPELNNPGLFFATLAFQLSQYDDQYKRALCEVLQRDKDVASSNLASQFEGLIRLPLSACRKRGPILLVLDALDECSPDDGVETILRLLLDPPVPSGANLRILIASRPESHIRFVFMSPGSEYRHEKVVLHDIDDNLARQDIEKYLKAEFAKFPSRNLPSLPKDWPPAEQFNKLLEHCGKFFAYAATAVRFIGDEGVRDPKGQITDLLDMKESQHVAEDASPYLELDKLYLGVLQRAASKNPRKQRIRRIRNVLGTVVCLRRPLRLSDLAKFLSASENDIRDALHFLHSVVLVPDGIDEPLRFFHQSFSDFIRDGTRCTDERFLVSVPAHEDFMASRCAIMNGKTYLAKRDDRFNFNDIISYTAIHWSSHLRSGTGNDSRLNHDDDAIWPNCVSNEEATVFEPDPSQRVEAGDGCCFSKTRESVLENFQSWITAVNDSGRHIFWAHGNADIGQPSIAIPAAKWARKSRGGIGGSFFFEFEPDPLFNPRFAFPVMASQLAQTDANYTRALYERLHVDGTSALESPTLHMQFNSLICEPLSACANERPALIVLGGDEQYFRREILCVLASLGENRLRVFISSTSDTFHRLVSSTQGGESLSTEAIRQYEIDANIHDSEIRTYLQSEFARISSERRADTQWPPPEQFDRLLSSCGNSYAFAATTVRFVAEKGTDGLDSQLSILLDIIEAKQTIHGNSPNRNLDQLYLGIFDRAAAGNPESDVQRMQCVIATIVSLRKPLEVEYLADFLSLSVPDVRTALAHLHSLMEIPEDDHDPIELFHPSLRDFMKDKERCTDERFVVNISEHENYMAIRCIESMKNSTGSWYYAKAQWTIHARAGTDDGLSDELEQDLIWLIGNTDMLAEAYDESKYIEDSEDAIPFVRSLVEKHRPKESETMLALLRDAEADKDVSRKRGYFLGWRRKFFGL